MRIPKTPGFKARRFYDIICAMKTNHLVAGVLAHVDAGKTTLTEAILYKTGKTRTLGRVDHRDAFLDTDRQEKSRGITIFSKQALFDLSGKRIYLQDTPGHVDFSSEMERSLKVLDYAILVISAPDGIQAHTRLLMELLEKHRIPTFVFVNKTDIECSAPKLPDNWVDFAGSTAELAENLALCSESAMEEYLQTGGICDDTIKKMILRREVLPVYRGSALKLTGIDEFLEGFSRYAVCRDYPEAFGAKCFKITRDNQGNRLSWLKITGGSLCVRELLKDEKVTQIRFYSGSKFEAADRAEAGCVCAVCGPENTFAGQGFGFEKDQTESSLEPVLTYRIRALDGTDDNTAFRKLEMLAEEDPLLHIVWNPAVREIQAQLMGRVQTEVLTEMIKDRLDMEVSIEEGRVVYKETIANAVEGVGHFEPLRHYAEVHLLLEPLEAGSGLVLETACSEDVLDRNWQRLILYNLAEYRHAGVLTGAPLTDVKITLVAGRSHLKHTEGGDFRQASLRAVRQGLMKAENVLLEPFYQFTAEVPAEQIGRVISDLKAMGGSFDAPESREDMAILTGLAPVSELQTYQNELLSYTKGRGRLFCRYAGYYPCHNTEKIVKDSGYDPDRDTENPTGSVFCSHGAGILVKWDHVEEFMHMESGLKITGSVISEGNPKLRPGNFDFDEKELDEIMQREFGAIKRPKYSTVVYEPDSGASRKISAAKKEYMIIDGYNMIFAWKEMKALANLQIAAARESLIDILSEFRSVRGCEMVVVFDGYKVRGNEGTKLDYSGINVIYTKEGQSADAYIESFVKDLGHSYNVVVASSDGMIQLTALRQGTRRMSAGELEHVIAAAKGRIEEIIAKYAGRSNKLGDFAKISDI